MIRGGRLCARLFRLTLFVVGKAGRTRFVCLAGWSRRRR